jgi:proteasome lid subunit RPN8/RPN11
VMEIPVAARELVLSASQHDLMVRHACGSAGREVCGFLGGVGGRVSDVLPIGNAASEPGNRFVMEPQEQWRAMCGLSARGKEIVGIYHSHPPGGSTEPSPIDVADVSYPEALQIIIVPDKSGKIANLRAFSIDAGQVSEVSIVIQS